MTDKKTAKPITERAKAAEARRVAAQKMRDARTLQTLKSEEAKLVTRLDAVRNAIKAYRAR